MDSIGDRAAYSASQPLYDALRSAVQRVDESRQLLELAMIEVRNEHVQARSDRVRYGATQQEQYVDRSVSAWRSITGSFASVFQEMSSLTEPNPAEGRSERPSHKLLGTLHQTTIAAKCAAEAFPVLEDDQSQRQNRGNRAQSRQHKQQQHAKFKTFAGEIKAVAPSKRVLSEGALNAEGKPSKVRRLDDATAAQPVHHSNRKSPRPSTPISGNEVHPSGSTNVQEELESLVIDQSVTKQPSDPAYQVQYEDVSAEVEARLQAKEQKRRETKGEMKRKRNSTQSIGGNDGADNAKPYRKKVKNRKSETEAGESKATESSGIKRGAAETSAERADGSVKRARLHRQD